MSIKLGDDGTLNTVLFCDLCNEEMRFSSLVENCERCEETNAEICEHRDELIDDLIAEEENDHLCSFEYYINLNERGEFSADVRNHKGNTVFAIPTIEELENLIDAGFMKYFKDTENLRDYLVSLDIIPKESSLEKIGSDR